MMSALILAEGEAHSEHAMTLPFEPYWFGVIALCVFLLLLALTWAFRHTAEKVGQQRLGHVADGATAHHAGTTTTTTTTYGAHH